MILYSLGWNLETLNVTYNGHLLAKLTSSDSVQAHCLQIGALYLFDAKYEENANGGALPENSDFINFSLRFFFDMNVKKAKKGKKNEIDRPLDLMKTATAFAKN